MRVRGLQSRTIFLTIGILLLGMAGGSGAYALPRIKILTTGGTIAGVQTNGGAAYESGVVTAEQLIQAVPEVKKIAEVSGEAVSNIGSQAMTNAIWLKLAGRLEEALKDPKVDGVVITHGTDTMEETSYFLNLVTKSDKPVVMVGSMRPSTAISADGPMNLYNAIALAANPLAKDRGVLVVMNDEIHYAREVEKTNTTQLNAFSSPNRGRAGVIEQGDLKLFSKPSLKYGTHSEFSVQGVRDLPRVEIVYSYANLGRQMIDFLVRDGAAGIVLAGDGDGDTTDEALAGLADAVKKGVAVVRSTRVGSGITYRNVEISDDDLGFVVSGELNPQKARVLLMLGLMKTHDPRKLQEYFYEY